jgi:hypothetical protein
MSGFETCVVTMDDRYIASGRALEHEIENADPLEAAVPTTNLDEATATVSISPHHEEISMPRTARDGIKRRLISDGARRALDELSDQDLHELREALREHSGEVSDSIPPQRNPANFLHEDKTDERKYPRNAANPGLPEVRTSTSDARRRAARDADNPQSSLETPMEDEAPDSENASIARIIQALRQGDERHLRLTKQILGDADFKRLCDLLLKEMDLSPEPQADDEPESFSGQPRPGGEMYPLAAEDAALLPSPIFNALAAARHIKFETSTVPSPPRRREIARQRLVSLAMDSSSSSSFARMFPSAAKVRVG